MSHPQIMVRFPSLTIFFLALGSFAIGTTEFAVMPLLAQISQNLQVSYIQATHLVTAYASGVVVGAPLLALVLTNLPRRKALVLCLSFFILMHIACVLSPNFTTLMVFRFLSGLPHGAYLGIGALFASGIMGPKNRGKAVARVLSGLTIATIIGAPLISWVGEFMNWRIFLIASIVVATIAMIGILNLIPANYRQSHADLRHEVKALGNIQIWLVLTCGAIGFGGMFAIYSYIGEILSQFTHVSADLNPWIFCVFGIGFTAGYMTMGNLIDKSVTWSGVGIIIWSILWLATFPLIVNHIYMVFIWIFAIGIGGGIGAVLQVRLMDVAGPAQTMAAALNHSAFNTANAIGPFVSGIVLTYLGNHNYPIVGYVGAVLACFGLVLWIINSITYRQSPSTNTQRMP